MITKTFANETEAIAYLTEGRPEQCAVSLNLRFHDALAEGLDVQLAAEKAELLHSHFDHGNGIGDEAQDFSTDAEAEAYVTDALLSNNEDGRAQERVDSFLTIFRRFRSWEVELFYAAKAAHATAEYEWYKIPENNEDEAVLRADIAAIENPRVRAFALKTFEETLKETGIVHFAGQAAEEAADAASQLESLLGGLLGAKDEDSPVSLIEETDRQLQ